MNLLRRFYPTVVFALAGCTLPGLIQPMRQYNLESGNTIEVHLHQTSRDHGIISSSSHLHPEFQGEYTLLDRYSVGYPPPQPRTDFNKLNTTELNSDDLAELYGFGKNSAAQPVGTGILLGQDSTVIQIVFYRISADRETGDGVGKDNRGRYYRVFFSTEEQ